VLPVAFDARQHDVLIYGDKTGPLDTDGSSIGVVVAPPLTATSKTGRSHWEGSGVHPTLNQSKNIGGVGLNNQELFSQRGAYLVGDPHVAHVVAPSQAVPIDLRQAARGEKNTNDRTDGGAPGTGIGEPGDPAYTVSQRQQAVAHVVAPPLTATNDPGRILPVTYAPMTLAFKPGQSEAAGATFITEEFAPTLQAQNNGSTAVPAVMQAMAVRRLTPTECERLQGFPDGWTQIPWKGKAASECPDGPRYKALGNSMACNVMRWIGTRIAMVDALKG
jgi:DNA (cytosine-5)-methyltransferase 1